MSRDKIIVQYPVTDETQSVATTVVEAANVVAENGICIEKAFDNKNNSLVIMVYCSNEAESSLTLKKGDAYPNSILGDLTVKLTAGKTTAVQIQDASRFETKEGELNLDFAADFSGTIYAVAKTVALNV